MIEENTNEANNKQSRQDEIEEIELTVAALKAEIKQTRHKQRLNLYVIFAMLIGIAAGIYLTVVNSNAIFKPGATGSSPDLMNNGASLLFSYFAWEVSSR